MFFTMSENSITMSKKRGKNYDYWEIVKNEILHRTENKSKSYILNIEWNLIEPEKNKYDKECILKYKNIVLELHKSSVIPIISLHNFSKPDWFVSSGGWYGVESVKMFEKYTEYVVLNLIDFVKIWLTFNKPNYYLFTDFYNEDNKKYDKRINSKMISCIKNIIHSHIKSYGKINEIALNKNIDGVKVGFSHMLRSFHPKNDTFFNSLVKKKFEYYFNTIFIKGMSEGRLLNPLGNNCLFGKGKFADFLGVEYYGSSVIDLNFSDILNVFNIFKFLYKYLLIDNGDNYSDEIINNCKSLSEKYNNDIFLLNNTTDNKRYEEIFERIPFPKNFIEVF